MHEDSEPIPRAAVQAPLETTLAVYRFGIAESEVYLIDFDSPFGAIHPASGRPNCPCIELASSF